jgi:hypothetical protein
MLVIHDVNKMTPLKGQASWANMMSPGGKLKALKCHPTKKVNKAEELTYLLTNIGNTTHYKCNAMTAHTSRNA